MTIRHRFGIILLKALGILLITAALLKAYELLVLPVANKDIWSYRPFLIAQVELELALGVWFISGWQKRKAWLMALLCFGMFCGVTLYKHLTGADSCGCFGLIHIKPWITLTAVDLPAFLLLFLCPVKKTAPTSLPFLSANRGVFVCMTLWLISLLSVTTAGLVMHVPQKVTATFETLEPETWIGQPLPILSHIDIAEQIQQGNWLIMLYHHDCPDCAKAMPIFEEIAENFVGNESILQLARIEIPPYFDSHDTDPVPYQQGRMDTTKKWLVVTPAVLFLSNGQVQHAWEQATMPTFDEVLETIMSEQQSFN